MFDALVFERARGRVVLDAGCGDGTFTARVARVAARVTGLDFSRGMLENARVHVEREGVGNVEFVCAHAWRDVPLAAGAFDVAYSRRGPNITVTVPAFVREGGVLLGLHPLVDAAEEERYRRGLQESGLDVVRFEGFDDTLRFPTLGDFTRYLSRVPGMPDFRLPEHAQELRRHAEDARDSRGEFVRRVHFLLWEARRPPPRMSESTPFGG